MTAYTELRLEHGQYGRDSEGQKGMAKVAQP
jgi:hypothetical protein